MRRKPPGLHGASLRECSFLKKLRKSGTEAAKPSRFQTDPREQRVWSRQAQGKGSSAIFWDSAGRSPGVPVFPGISGEPIPARANAGGAGRWFPRDKAGMSAAPAAGRGREPQRPSALGTSLRPWTARSGCSGGLGAGFGSGWERSGCPGRDKGDPHPPRGAGAGEKGEQIGKGRSP